MHGAKLGRLTLAVALICTLAFSRGASPHSAYALTFAVAVLDNSYNPEPLIRNLSPSRPEQPSSGPTAVTWLIR
jgi:hypothetical protein